MIETLALRLIAIVVTALALSLVARGVTIAASGAPHESWLRFAARLAFAAVLLQGARLAWRRPAGLRDRSRRRLLRLVAVAARPELFADYAESTPSVDAREAFLDDWRGAWAAVPAAERAAAFEAGAALALDQLNAAAAEAEAACRAGADVELAWRALVKAASTARTALVS